MFARFSPTFRGRTWRPHFRWLDAEISMHFLGEKKGSSNAQHPSHSTGVGWLGSPESSPTPCWMKKYHPLLSYLRGRVVSQLSVVLGEGGRPKGTWHSPLSVFRAQRFQNFSLGDITKQLLTLKTKKFPSQKRKKILKKHLYHQFIVRWFNGCFFFGRKTSLVVAICLDCAMPSQEALEIGNAFGWAGTAVCRVGVWWRWFNMYMGVSLNGGFSPQIIHFNRVFHYQVYPFWGTTIFRKTPI